MKSSAQSRQPLHPPFGPRGRLRLAVAVALSSLGFATAAHAQPQLTPDLPVQNAEEQQEISFALTLPLHNRAELDQLLKDLYTPGSPRYQQFLSSAEFDERYAPTQQDYDALKALAMQYGLQVHGDQPGRTILNVSAPAATVRSLFRTQMEWRQATDGRQYLAPQNEADTPMSLLLMNGGVVGLDAHPLHTHLRGARPVEAPHAGLGGGGSYQPNDIKTAYNVKGIQNGGQPVALLELSSAKYTDAATYAKQFGLHNPTLTQVKVDGGTTSTTGAMEVMLDIEMVMAISNPTSMYIYTGPATFTGALDTYSKIASDNKVAQVSTSWGLAETYLNSSAAQAENSVFTKMVAEGIAVFAASGDSGANDNGSSLSVDDPAVQPNVTGVGGTRLTTTTAQVYSSETVWHTNSTEGGGGGISKLWTIPSYQKGIVSHATSGQFSTTMRNVPDVSLNADPSTGYLTYCSSSGGWILVGGTSAAAPLWAGFWSLVGKGLTPAGATPVRTGFANPKLYTIGKNATLYAKDFHDVTSGNNSHYSAVAGYDTASGWGSFNAGNLYSALGAK
jgi:kumamolisin